MATTTASITVRSNDLTGSPLSISANSTLMKTGLTTGMTLMEMGNHSIATGTEFALSLAKGEVNGAHWLYMCNTSTDDTYWMDWGYHDTMMGRLYAGDWMFVPWNNAVADDQEIEVEANTGTNTFEYAIFKGGTWTLATAGA